MTSSGFSFDATGDSTSGGRGPGSRVTIRDLMYDAQRRLTTAGVPSPKVDAAVLMSWALDVPRSRLIMQDEPTAAQRLAFEKAVSRRLSRIPLQHITGRAPFRHIELAVGPGVFIPRPETEIVAEAAMRHAREIDQPVVVDLCAGSGAIGLSVALEVAGSRVHLVELDDDAIEWTRRNVREFEDQVAAAGSEIEVIHGDVTHIADPRGALSSFTASVDVVVANPPYIPDAMVPREVEVRDHDPTLALFGGPDGLRIIAGVVRTAAILLRPGGSLVIEHADVQGPDATDGGVVGLIKAAALDDELATMVPGLPGAPLFQDVSDRLDLAGLPRFTMATRSTATRSTATRRESES